MIFFLSFQFVVVGFGRGTKQKARRSVLPADEAEV
jgi:hypothetical protein